MGQCLPCMGGAVKDVVETPDPEIKRRQLAEAAEKRQMEASSRGIKNAYAVEQKKKKQEEIEKRIAASRPGGEGGLRCLWNATIRCHVFGAVLVMQLGIENICAEDRHKTFCSLPASGSDVHVDVYFLYFPQPASFMEVCSLHYRQYFLCSTSVWCALAIS
ncbi:small VCP/p97-interacting protein isoform 6-T6 [Cyanocitta cristata]